ncbi:recombinase [Candidatus Sumerlaeota bacterium]|nr:recombinase [Candidatus Sumerlaeota bacterium]
MDEYEKWEQDCKRIRSSNNKLLLEFGTALKKDGLSEKTIDKHLNNVDFYINEYLLYDDAREPQDGIHAISMFLGYWFIKKAMWSSTESIKSNASSLKKFYGFLLEKGMIDNESYVELKQTIKDEMSEWLATMERYEDPEIEDMEDVWRF